MENDKVFDQKEDDLYSDFNDYNPNFDPQVTYVLQPFVIRNHLAIKNIFLMHCSFLRRTKDFKAHYKM